jgi:hypothetical protein
LTASEKQPEYGAENEVFLQDEKFSETALIGSLKIEEMKTVIDELDMPYETKENIFDKIDNLEKLIQHKKKKRVLWH